MSKIVYRTLDVFEIFAQQRRPLSLTELVRLLEIPVSSCHDVVHALVDRGYLYEVKPRGGFYPSSRWFNLAKIILDHDPVADRAQPHMRAISDALSASVSLAKAQDMQLTYLLVANSPDPLQFSVSAGSKARNFYATSAGKAFLGGLPVQSQKDYLESIERPALTSHTITDVDDILANIAEAEQRGWHTNCEESVEDALTLSVRFDWSNSVYVLTAAGTLTRMKRQLDVAAHLMQQAAQSLRLNDSP